MGVAGIGTPDGGALTFCEAGVGEVERFTEFGRGLEEADEDIL